MNGPNQLSYQLDVSITEDDLLKLPEGEITLEGVKTNVHALVKYTEAWLDGYGAVSINNMMEDAATAEISRLQLWSWLNNNISINDNLLNKDLICSLIDEETDDIFIRKKISSFICQETPDEFMTTSLMNCL